MCWSKYLSKKEKGKPVATCDKCGKRTDKTGKTAEDHCDFSDIKCNKCSYRPCSGTCMG